MHPKPDVPDGTHRFECRECLSVVVDAERPDCCPSCGGRVRNVSVPRE